MSEEREKTKDIIAKMKEGKAQKAEEALEKAGNAATNTAKAYTKDKGLSR